MISVSELLELSKDVAVSAGQRLFENSNSEHKHFTNSVELPKEVKAAADIFLEKEILDRLTPIGLPILSEESGYIPGEQETKLWFIIDPLDGTYNFVKGLGPSAISIALWSDRTPIFGVVYSLDEQKIYWGGRDFGSYCNGKELLVSDCASKDHASICTGFPVRFDVTDEDTMQRFWNCIRFFSKVRMIGAASVSLVHVSSGSADLYYEKNIMLWDVAAGLAIIEGAGGEFILNETSDDWSCNVVASNGKIRLDNICTI